MHAHCGAYGSNLRSRSLEKQKQPRRITGHNGTRHPMVFVLAHTSWGIQRARLLSCRNSRKAAPHASGASLHISWVALRTVTRRLFGRSVANSATLRCSKGRQRSPLRSRTGARIPRTAALGGVGKGVCETVRTSSRRGLTPGQREPPAAESGRR